MPTTAFYGLSEYGEDLYGVYTPNFLGIDEITVVSYEYGSLQLSWDILQTGYSSVRVVRSSIGAPVISSEGVIIYEVDEEDDTGIYIDTDVTPGVLYYYSLFIFDDATESWLLTAIGQGIPLKDWGYQDRLWELTPETYRESDLSVAADNPYFDDGPLKRFLNLFAGEYDHIRSEYETLRNLTNIPLIPADFLLAVAHQFNLEVEPVLGAILTRRFLDNAVYIYKRKGSILGTEVLIRATTGWDNDVSWDNDGGGPSPHVAISIAPDRLNHVYNPSFEYSTNYKESWLEGTNTTFSEETGAGNFSDALTGLGVIATAGGDVEVLWPHSSYDRATVTELRNYNISLDIKSPLSRDAVLHILWYDVGEVLLETSSSDPIPTTTGFTRIDFTAAAPVDAVTAAFTIEIQGLSAAEKHYIDAVLFEQIEGTTAGNYFDGGSAPATEYLWEGTNHLSRTMYFERLVIKQTRLEAILEEFLPPNMDVEITYVGIL